MVVIKFALEPRGAEELGEGEVKELRGRDVVVRGSGERVRVGTTEEEERERECECDWDEEEGTTSISMGSESCGGAGAGIEVEVSMVTTGGATAALIMRLTTVPSFSIGNSLRSLLSPIAFPLRIHRCDSGEGAVGSEVARRVLSVEIVAVVGHERVNKREGFNDFRVIVIDSV